MAHEQADAIKVLRARRDEYAARIAQIDKALAALESDAPAKHGGSKRGRKLTAAGRAAISKAAKKRWAKYRKAGK